MWHVQRLMMGGSVQRYHTWPMPPQNVGNHSYGVAMIVQRLWPECRKELLLAALQHDLGEQELGDVPAPAKWRAPQFFAHLNEAEAKARLDMGFSPHEEELTAHERQVLKIADILELCAFARYAINCGHVGAQIVWENGYRYAMGLLFPPTAPASAPGVHEGRELLGELTRWGSLMRSEVMGETPKVLPKQVPTATREDDVCLCYGRGCNRCEPQGRG